MLVKSNQHTNLLGASSEIFDACFKEENLRDLRQKIRKGSETKRKNGLIWTAYLIQKLSQAGSCVVQLFNNFKVDESSDAI